MTGAADSGPEGAWDLPRRLFHWALVVLVVFSYATGKIGGGWMEWHMRSGYAVLALHGINQGVIVTAVVIHVLAVTFYQWRLRMDTLRPMLAGVPSRPATLALATLLLAVSAMAVYALVAIYPRP